MNQKNEQKKFSVLDIILLIITPIFIYMVGTVVFNDFDVTKRNFLGFSVHHVMSESMEPTIMTDDYILARQIEFEDVEVGDIIIYKHEYEDGTFKSIVHRVIAKTDEYLTMKGDNNATQDPWAVYPQDVRSIVIGYD